MARLFGTDGVRGIANSELTAELALNLGRAAAVIFSESMPKSNSAAKRPRFVIGKDTRISGDMLESALAAGLMSAGVDVIRVGILPTPAVAFLIRHLEADGGAMISASHNPVPDNGIKFFDASGFKRLMKLKTKSACLEQQNYVQSEHPSERAWILAKPG